MVTRAGQYVKKHSLANGIILIMYKKVLNPMPFSILKSAHPGKCNRGFVEYMTEIENSASCTNSNMTRNHGFNFPEILKRKMAFDSELSKHTNISKIIPFAQLCVLAY